MYPVAPPSRRADGKLEPLKEPVSTDSHLNALVQQQERKPEGGEVWEQEPGLEPSRPRPRTKWKALRQGHQP